MKGWNLLQTLRWGDLLLIAAIIVASVVVVPLLRAHAPGATRALVFVGDELIAELDLKEDRRLTVTGPLGETEIEVRDGRVRVVRSPGPYKLCIKRGWISRPGEALICLPNRVIVEIPGQRRDYDALVY